MGAGYDVAVIGAGIIGAATARELMRYDLSVVILEKANDVSCGVTKANSGIVHAGHDALPGTNKAFHNVRGNALYDIWSKELDFPFRRNGSFVLFHDDKEKEQAKKLYERGAQNGVAEMELIGYEKVHELEPNLKTTVRGALWLKTGGITCPFEFAIAACENAVKNGAVIRTSTKAEAIERRGDGFDIATSKGHIRSRAIVNAAGLFADDINNMISEKKLRIIPRRGQYMLMDNAAGAFFARTLFNVPGRMGKGVLISPTVDGNLFLGPTAEDIDDKEDTSTTPEGMRYIEEQARLNWDYPDGRWISQFAGLRPHLSEGNDFIIGETEPGFFNACGIESPGLTAAPSIGETLSKEVAAYLNAGRNAGFDPIRKAIPRFRTMTEKQRKKAIADDIRYSHVLCRCEQVTEAEVVDAVRRGARTLDAVKRRTRAGMGKCQRGFCGPEALAIIARELGVDKSMVLQGEEGTEILTGRIGGVRHD